MAEERCERLRAAHEDQARYIKSCHDEGNRLALDKTRDHIMSLVDRADTAVQEGRPEVGGFSRAILERQFVKAPFWVAHYGMSAVQVLSPEATLEATYDAGMPLVRNLCFGPDGLYVPGGANMPGPGVLTRLDIG